MKFNKKFSEKLTVLKEKFSQSRGKGSPKTETQIFNHPNRDSAVRSGKK